ncbi:uncharacterized protein FA14DRAFT_92357 [Meira miltonrushii]|uniref:phosphatidylinositol-3,4,5-trisphosphate 3-phosphatase n=1 Tax=Meira miltonrushii TaxID=1280837 RepID=A0A316V5E0_9BASI|nr:uncharacterized protein FA14DRAFT_92357 [Meira miltonrushii]PWN31721.1 hypothetical protein FA14DRAFT_92357 [Meira miltonrushii]
MTTFLRRIVSGPKARYVDKDLGVDLDLVYVSDRLIIMGWPAANFEAIYRNKRKTVRKFLDAKHGEYYRVYNLCPCWENSYDSNEFYGEVGRYPFPDHHPPPLSMIPMFVCDITAWLAKDARNVAVIHCKAGKGRSGTMACSYLLSLPILPPPPTSSQSTKEIEELDSQRKQVADKELVTSPTTIKPSKDDGSPLLETVMLGNLLAEHPEVKDGVDLQDTKNEQAIARTQAAQIAIGGKDQWKQAYTEEALSDRLRNVFELHTSRRLKAPRVAAPPIAEEKEPASFLQSDPSTSMQRKSSDSGRVRRSKSVSNLVRKASKTILRTSPAKQSPPKSSVDLNRANDSATPISSPPRDSTASPPDQSPTRRRSSQLDLKALGVTPMGKSTTDLRSEVGSSSEGRSSSQTNRRKASSPKLPPVRYGGIVQSIASNTRAQKSQSANSTPFDTPTKQQKKCSYFPNSDGLLHPEATLAPALYRPGDVINVQSDQPLPDTPSPNTANASQVSIGGPYAENVDFDSDMESEGEDENAVPPVRLAVSIPSQRRFVGYWARILSGNDPRGDVTSETKRKIRIIQIQVDRRVQLTKAGEVPKNAGGALSIHLGRYDPDLETRLRGWETNARRRTRAFGFSDPSAATPDLPQLQLKEHGTDYRGPARKAEEENAYNEQWRHVERQNSGQKAYDTKLSAQGASFWGINVLAEQERARNFAWANSGHDDLLDKNAQREASKRETDINIFASVREQSRHTLEASTTQADFRQTEQRASIVRHQFQLGKTHLTNGAPVLPTWLNSTAWQSRRSVDHQGPRRLSSSNDTSPSGSSMWGTALNDPHSGPHLRVTPPTSIESLPNTHSHNGNEEEFSEGEESNEVILDADNALQIKMLVGRSGASHAQLPDIASCGYVWFIPSFETPVGQMKKGQRIRRTFTAQEIDFRKGKQVSKILGGEIRRLSVEWEWVEVEDDEDEEEEKVTSYDATLKLPF